MAQIHVVGRVTAELELQVSHAKNPYDRFTLEERLHNGRCQRYDVWAYGWDAEHLVQWKVKPGSILEVNGPLFAEEYTAKDGVSPGVRLKIIYKDGGPIRWGKPNRTGKKESTTPAETAAAETPSPSGEGVIDGEREPLPE